MNFLPNHTPFARAFIKGSLIGHSLVAVAWILLWLSGCDSLATRPPIEQARAATATAIAIAQVDYVKWEGPLPLIGDAVESDPPLSGTDDVSDHLLQDLQMVYTEIDWQPFTLATVQAAKETGQTIWIHTSGDNCPPCDKADKLLSDSVVVDAASDLVAVKLNVSRAEGRPAKSAYGVGAVPTDLAIFPNGKFLRYVGLPEDATAAGYAHRLKSFEQVRDQAKWPGYPNDGNGVWKLNGERVGWQHLRDDANHRNKFNVDWLSSLKPSDLQQLHSDDHENTVRWAFVPPVEAAR